VTCGVPVFIPLKISQTKVNTCLAINILCHISDARFRGGTVAHTQVCSIRQYEAGLVTVENVS
jgi:hypothetical protein